MPETPNQQLTNHDVASEAVSTNIRCMHCMHEVRFRAGSATRLILLAIRARDDTLGTDVYCRHCRQWFVAKNQQFLTQSETCSQVAVDGQPQDDAAKANVVPQPHFYTTAVARQSTREN